MGGLEVSGVSPVVNLQGISSALWPLSEGNRCALTKFENCTSCQKLNRNLFKHFAIEVIAVGNSEGDVSKLDWTLICNTK